MPKDQSKTPNLVLTMASLAARLLPMQAKRLIYRYPRLAGLIRGELNKAAPQGLTEVCVASGALIGLRLSLNLQKEKDYWLGTYEPELQAALVDILQPGDVAYDLGANIGFITLLMAYASGEAGRVYAFEALPDNLERLRLNLGLNHMDNRVSVVHAAVGNSSEPVSFLPGPSGGTGKMAGSGGRQELEYAEAIQVPGVVLDRFVYTDGNPLPNVLKIDIEGGEVLALPGMHRVLSEGRPTVLIELHGPEAARVAWDELVAAGYRICRMAPGYPAADALEKLDWKSYLAGFPLE